MKKLDLAISQFLTRRGLVLFAATLALALKAIIMPAQAELPPASKSGLGVQSPVSNAAVRQFMSDAQKAMKNGNFRLALILMKNAVSADPSNGAVRAQLGLVLLQAQDPVGAERELRQARIDGAPDRIALPILLQTMLQRHEERKLLDEFPDPSAAAHGPADADLLKARAIALQALGQPADAASAMDRSLALRRDISGLLARGRLAQQQGDPVMAKKLNDEALQIDPKSLDALIFKLGLLMLANNTNGALSLSDAILKQYPDSIGVRLARIETFLKFKQDAKAKVDVDAILARTPGIQIGLYYKALLLARANDVKGAWRIAQTLTPDFDKSSPSIAIMVSQMAIGGGATETGAAILSAMLAIAPDLVEVRLRLAALRLRQKSPEAALDILLPAKESKDARILAMLSQVDLALGKYSDALDALNRLKATGSAGPGVQREVALVEMRAGQTEQGLKDLSDLAAKQPTDPTIVAPLIATLVQAKRFPEALSAADRLGADPKQRVQSYFFRGQILEVQGDAAGAITAFQQALQLDPKNVATLFYRGGLYEDQRKFPEAERDYRAILAIDPKNVVTIVKLAEVAARQNQDKNVRALLAQATSIAPRDQAPRLALVRYLIAKRDFKAALSAANDLIQIVPGDTDGLTLFGELQQSLGQKKEAIATFRRLSTLQPKSAAPQMLLANALLLSGDRAGASGALYAAAKLEPKSGEVCAAQINFLFEQGDTSGAIAVARSFQASNPGVGADLLLADTLVRSKQSDQAISVLTQSLSTTPNSDTLVRLVRLTAAAGDRKKAESLLTTWIATNPRDAKARAEYATYVMQDGDRVKAAAQYEMVLAVDPHNLTALNNLGWLLQNRDPKRALSMVSLAYELTPNSPDVEDSLGWIKLHQNDPKGALELLNRAHALRPKDGEITYHLVLAIDANGNRNSARGLLKALLESGESFDDVLKAQQLSATWH